MSVLRGAKPDGIGAGRCRWTSIGDGNRFDG